MSNKNIITGILCLLTAFSSTAIATGTYWMNSWSEDCYNRGENTCRRSWYSIPQGSHLLRWEVFETLELPNARSLFSSQNSLSQFGFLFPKEAVYLGDINEGIHEEPFKRGSMADNLPIGMIKDTSLIDNEDYMGFTCAACHTGEITYGDNRYIIEAGQANLDFTQFIKGLITALEANRTGLKLNRYKARFANYVTADRGLDTSPLEAENLLDEAIKSVKGYFNRNRYAVANGPGRVDAIGSILNQLYVHHMGLDDRNAKPLSAPVSFPYIWNVGDLECVQTNCISNNDALSRNAGEVIGVFGYVNLDEDENIPNMEELEENKAGNNNLFQTTVKINNLKALERAIGGVKPPKWPSAFPALDQELISQGHEIYSKECANCHVDRSNGISAFEQTAPDSDGVRKTKVTRVPYKEVGTDSAFITSYGSRNETMGILGEYLASVNPDFVDPNTGIRMGDRIPEKFNGLIMLGIATSTFLNKQQLSPANISKAEMTAPTGTQPPTLESLMVYKAKPLEGIAFTGPYLHNGSVRTLKDLLNPPNERESSFKMGTTEYDVEGAGYKSEGYFSFNTGARGNRNSGHVYGTNLPDDEKAALLEFLKSI